MSDPSQAPTENYRVLGEDTTVEVVRSSVADERDWLQDAPICTALGQYHIVHAGIMHAQAPFNIARAHQSGTFMLACFDGEGQVLADGRWKTVRAGDACLLPPFVSNQLKCVDGKSWSFCWVRYLESENACPIATESSPVSFEYDSTVLRLAIRGLISESVKTDASLPMLDHWVELVHRYVLGIVNPDKGDRRLWKLWSEVKKDLGKSWTLSELAALVHMSDEHLRRLCKKQLGRSPMQHLTFLRMKHASELLTEKDVKIETIAHDLGYSSAAHFSDVFVKWVGCRPSEYRT